jgi:putative phosphoesterase
MKIGVLSDIHSNAYALKEVLRVAEKENVEKLLILGDIVGYYYEPEVVMEMLSNYDHDMIKGNHEVILENLIKGNLSFDSVREKYGSGHKLAIHKLDDKQITTLLGLPEKKTIVIDGISFLMSHGSPWDADYYVYPDASIDDLTRCDSPDHDFVLIGHTHHSFCYKNKKSMLLNPGSVGQSRQVGGVATWAIINTLNKCFEMKSTPYPVNILQAEIAQIDPQISYLSNILKRK